MCKLKSKNMILLQTLLYNQANTEVGYSSQRMKFRQNLLYKNSI